MSDSQDSKLYMLGICFKNEDRFYIYTFSLVPRHQLWLKELLFVLRTEARTIKTIKLSWNELSEWSLSSDKTMIFRNLFIKRYSSLHVLQSRN